MGNRERWLFASMEPRSLERGELSFATPARLPPDRFNGAALVRARRVLELSGEASASA